MVTGGDVRARFEIIDETGPYRSGSPWKTLLKLP